MFWSARSGSLFPQPARSDLEDRPKTADPATERSTVKIPIVGPNQRRERVIAVRAAVLAAEAVKGRERAARGDFEDRPILVGTACGRGPVEASIGTLDEPRDWVGSVRTPALRAEVVDRGERAARSDLEDRATASIATGIDRAAALRCPVSLSQCPECDAVRQRGQRQRAPPSGMRRSEKIRLSSR